MGLGHWPPRLVPTTGLTPHDAKLRPGDPRVLAVPAMSHQAQASRAYLYPSTLHDMCVQPDLVWGDSSNAGGGQSRAGDQEGEPGAEGRMWHHRVILRHLSSIPCSLFLKIYYLFIF